jgi:hypothetical protein
MSTIEMTAAEILDRGRAALLRELGPLGYVRFLQQLVPGRGDYRRDRDQWIDSVKLGDIKARGTAGKARRTPARPKRRATTRQTLKKK